MGLWKTKASTASNPTESTKGNAGSVNGSSVALPVPEDVTIHNLSGVYGLNHALSDSSQAVLKMQRVNWMVRQAVAYSALDVTLKQYVNEEGRHCLDQEQLSTGGVKNFEDRVMDWEPTVKHNWIWGEVNGRSRYVALSELEDEYLKSGWSQDTIEGEVVEVYAESVTDTWSATQIWGFAVVDGQRRHVRKILAQKPGSADLRIRMVYDWKSGPV